MALIAGQCRMAIAVLLVAGLMSSFASVETVLGQTPLGTWTMKAPLPAVRAEVAAVALGGKLHALGGTTVQTNAGPYHDEYDPDANAWRARAPLPGPRDHLAVAVANGEIYAFGGFAVSVHKDASNSAFKYDVEHDRWLVLSPMKVARGAAGAATLNGKIHVIGGRNSDGVVVAAHEVFDPQSGTWSDAAPLPSARDHLVVIAGADSGLISKRPGTMLPSVVTPLKGVDRSFSTPFLSFSPRVGSTAA